MVYDLHTELAALLGIVEGMVLMYSIEILKELYREYKQSKRKEIERMLKSAIPMSTSTNYIN
jgi:hypothetical protein